MNLHVQCVCVIRGIIFSTFSWFYFLVLGYNGRESYFCMMPDTVKRIYSVLLQASSSFLFLKYLCQSTINQKKLSEKWSLENIPFPRLHSTLTSSPKFGVPTPSEILHIKLLQLPSFLSFILSNLIHEPSWNQIYCIFYTKSLFQLHSQSDSASSISFNIHTSDVSFSRSTQLLLHKNSVVHCKGLGKVSHKRTITTETRRIQNGKIVRKLEQLYGSPIH